eukprot:72798_1
MTAEIDIFPEQSLGLSTAEIDQGSARFYLQDMKWLWSRFFHQVNDKPQILCRQILDDIDHYTIHKQLPDDHFDEFMVQSQMKARLIPEQK